MLLEKVKDRDINYIYIGYINVILNITKSFLTIFSLQVSNQSSSISASDF